MQYTNRKERKLFPFSFYKFRVCASERALCLFMEPNTHPVLFTIVWLILLSAFCGSQIIYNKQTEMSIYIWQRRRRWKNIKTYIYFVTYVLYIASGFFFLQTYVQFARCKHTRMLAATATVAAAAALNDVYHPRKTSNFVFTRNIFHNIQTNLPTHKLSGKHSRANVNISHFPQ